MKPIEQALYAWERGESLRRRRLRYKRYTFGDQWGDIILTNTNEKMTEMELLRRTGHHPTTCNMILPAVTAIVGHYRQSATDNGHVSENLAEDCALLQEFLISGCAVQRLSTELRHGQNRTWVDNISPARFFIDRTATLSPHHTQLLGQLHDMSLMTLLFKFSHSNRRRASQLREIFEKEAVSPTIPSGGMSGLGQSVYDNIDFSSPSLPGTIRVVELWTLECGEITHCFDPETGELAEFPDDDDSLNRRNNRRRRKGLKPLQRSWTLIPKWHCRYLTPQGTLLHEYFAENHPYVYAFHPLIDGEIHPFVEDLIERQRHINRLLTLNDRILSTSAKGVLLFPENQASASQPLSEVAENWSAPDGIVLYNSRQGSPGPQQIVCSTSNLGLQTMLQTELSLISDISGVSAAMRGQQPSPATGAELYARQQQGSSTALAHLLGAFASFIDDRDTKLTALQAQGNKNLNNT
ncbi:MAG: hypothetical protein NC343_03510 [Muribaculum sp.]|nr:hypothetical protein [Muribaculaceae bacterium]MCM1080795.1 hypothetical protein [Muribaculum sp.]